MVTLSFTIFSGQKNYNRAHMLFQVLCGFEPIFYTTHPNEESNFKMFFKEQVTSFTEDNKFNGNLKITIGENNYDLKVPFQTLRTGSEGEIRNVWDLMEDYYPKSEDTSKVKNFLGNMSVFTRWYAYETRINDIFGDYEVAHKESS